MTARGASARLAVALTEGRFAARPSAPRAAHQMSVWDRTADGVLLGRPCARQDAQVAVFPHEIGGAIVTEADRQELLRLVAENAAAGLRTVLVLDHDHMQPVDLGQPAALVLRTSMIGTQEYVEEYPMPAWVADPWAAGTPRRRPWRPRPLVGFMGRVNPGFTHTMTAFSPGDAPPHGFSETDVAAAVLFPEPIDIGALMRRKAIAGLERSALVDTSIVEREFFFGHYDAATRATLRTEYAGHLAGSDYVLCVRGFGNYSIRLFETMAMGRVPVIVESELVLPCADVVDWDAIAVRVPVSDIDRIDEHVATAHAQGPGEFARRQEAARRAWVRWLSPPGFARYVSDVLLVDVR